MNRGNRTELSARSETDEFGKTPYAKSASSRTSSIPSRALAPSGRRLALELRSKRLSQTGAATRIRDVCAMVRRGDRERGRGDVLEWERRAGLRTMMSVATTRSDARALELSAGSSSFARDLSDLLRATGFVPPAVAVLADRATLAVEIAVREAAGSPRDERWYAAYDALVAFTIFYRRCAQRPDDVPSFARLVQFLAENADLARASVHPPNESRRAATYLFERS